MDVPHWEHSGGLRPRKPHLRVGDGMWKCPSSGRSSGQILQEEVGHCLSTGRESPVQNVRIICVSNPYFVFSVVFVPGYFHIFIFYINFSVYLNNSDCSCLRNLGESLGDEGEWRKGRIR